MCELTELHSWCPATLVSSEHELLTMVTRWVYTHVRVGRHVSPAVLPQAQVMKRSVHVCVRVCGFELLQSQ